LLGEMLVARCITLVTLCSAMLVKSRMILNKKGNRLKSVATKGHIA